MKGRCSVRGGLEQIRGEAFSIYLKWESVSVRQGCEWPNEALRSGQDPHHPKPIAASRSANKVFCTPRVWCITKMWRGAVQGLKWSHASSVVCSANPKKKKNNLEKCIFYFIFSLPEENKKTQKFRPSSTTSFYSSFNLACMVHALVFPLQFGCPITPLHLPSLMMTFIGGTQSLWKKDNKKYLRCPVTKRNEFFAGLVMGRHRYLLARLLIGSVRKAGLCLVFFVAQYFPSWNHVSLINISDFGFEMFVSHEPPADHQSFATAHKIKIFVHVGLWQSLSYCWKPVALRKPN